MNNLDDYMYLNTLPYDGDYTPPERIVCAANKYGDVVLCGVRHGSEDMYSLYDFTIDSLPVESMLNGAEEQGFITSKYRFVDRKEAWKIALEQRQIFQLVGSQTSSSANDPDTELFSENLY